MNKLYLHCACDLALMTGLICAPAAGHGEPIELTVASGHLRASAFGLFNFSLEHAVGAGESLKISTEGSNFDTEIAIYDAQGQMVATNDDIGPRNLLSQLKFGGRNALAAGEYTAVLSGFNTIYRNGDIVPGTSRGGDFQLKIQSTQPVLLPVVSSQLAMDGQILPSSIVETKLGQGWLDTLGVKQFNFFLQDDVLPGGWLAIHTTGSDFDTEIGLYDERGKLVATNDDTNSSNLLSRLSFGLDGDNGRSLAAGAYTVLMGGFNTIFHDNLVAESSMPHGGDYAVYVQSSGRISMTEPATQVQDSYTIPEPSSLLLMTPALLMLMRRREYATELKCHANAVSRFPDDRCASCRLTDGSGIGFASSRGREAKCMRPNNL